MTFFYTDGCERQTLEPIATEASRRGIEVKFTENMRERAEIGVYCQHACIPNADFSIIMLHDLAQRHDVWPGFWQQEPWNAFDIGLLPGDSWVDRWQTQSLHASAHPRLGVFNLGWPKADLALRDEEKFAIEAKKLRTALGLKHPQSILYAPSWENNGKQDDFVKSLVNLPVNLLLKQAPWSDDYPWVLDNIREMNALHKAYAPNVHIINVDVSIMYCMGLADVLVSDESSVLTEALLLDVPGVAVTDWLIPDQNPPRLASVPYDYVTKTAKAQLREVVEGLLARPVEAKRAMRSHRDHHFSNLGRSAELVMDTIEAAVRAQELPQQSVLPMGSARSKEPSDSGSSNSTGQSRKLSLSEFVPHKVTGVFVSDSNKVFDYSDGDTVENLMLEILSRASNTDVFSPDLVGAISDWPSEYHFSPRRANIIRPLANLGPETRVLELGCGFGAITKAFAEQGCQIDAVEGSFRRASAAASRVRNHTNARVHVSNFQDIAFEPIYDVVTLIGVLEYSPVYITAEDPFTECLRMASSALKPNGTLVIAIENKVGLKYFAGITEDHFAIPYYGIEGRYGPREITTYGKQQLTERLGKAGFAHNTFYYPYPDYKLPEVVLSEEAVRHPGFNAGDLISGLDNRDYSEVGKPAFRLDLAWESVAAEGLLGELANSFLILASRESLSAQIRTSVIAEKYTDDRAPAFNIATRFVAHGSAISVQKFALINDTKNNFKDLKHSLGNERYIKGRNLLSCMRRALSCENKDDFSKLLRLWIEYTKRSAERNLLPPDWIDAHPGNFILGQHYTLGLIDCEWTARAPIDVEFVLAYGLHHLSSDKGIASHLGAKNALDALQKLCNLGHIRISPETLDAVQKHRAAIWQGIYQQGLWRGNRYREANSPLDGESSRIDPTGNEKKTRDVPQNFSVKLLAFYLPQFHEIPENNAWWGEGFTEWTNVRQGKPLFEGHQQPLKPTELGYYDLSDTSVLAQQAKLAKDHGIFGFCFYYYWFDGKRLLEKPVDQLLAAPSIDLPFCLCWANENWTKRWDGGDHDVLMRQSYSPALDESFASDLVPYFADQRYITIEGKPVLLVYRTDIIPDLGGTIAAWRSAWRKLGVGEVYLVAVESFTSISPTDHGFDAAAEFPPHQANFNKLMPAVLPNLITDPDALVGDYRKLADTWLERPRPPYKRFRGLLPSWDNSARRRLGGATLFVNASPDVYEHWLTQSVGRTLDELDGEERLVFINAWNEWGEGCTLEPDERWGRGYLEATRRVLQKPEGELRALSRLNAPATDYEHWLAQATLTLDNALVPALCAAGTSVVLAVAVSGSDTSELDNTRASLAAQLRPANAIAMGAGRALAVFGPAIQDSDWTLCLCAGDTMTTDALAQLARALASAPAEALIAYLDHDECDEQGQLSSPFLKPAFNHELLLSCPYMGRALVVRSNWLQTNLLNTEATRFDLPFAYGLMLSTLREAGENGFIRVPVLALHLTTAEPTVFSATSTAWQALATLLIDHANQTLPGSQLIEGPLPGSFHLVPPLSRTPLVSIIIPTRDQLPFISRCVESLLAKTAYPSFELLIVDNDSQTTEAREFLSGLATVAPDRIRVLSVPGDFNFSRMNNLAAHEAQGEFLLLLNNDTAALHEDWLGHMVRQALLPGVGAVGARLLFPDGSVQHAGVVLGLCGPADHPLLGLPGDQPGYMARAKLTQNFSAVTAACLLVPRALYDEVGGLDEVQFGVSYNDVDLCLRIRATGRRIVWTPLATLLHEGSASQQATVEGKTLEQKEERFAAEQTAFYARWPEAVGNDPHYSPHLSLSERNYEIETRPALRANPLRGLTSHHVVAFAADETGCGHYRVLEPLRAMLDEGLCTGAPSSEYLTPNLLLRTGADTLIFQRPYTEAGLEAVRTAKATSSARIIYELDDNMAQVPIKNLHRHEMPKDLRGRILKGIGICDRLIVSTEPLAKALGTHTNDVRVVPNRLPPRMWGEAPPARSASENLRVSKKPRVGWAGGVGHSGDLEMIAEVVRELANEVEWVFFGMCPPALRPYISEYYAGVPTLDYPKRLMAMSQTWDLAIAPLEDNAFNECKSNLRLLEYGWCGVPVICSDITPYQGALPVKRVKNRFKDWVSVVRSSLADLPATQQAGSVLQMHVAANWMLRDQAVVEWNRAWTS